MINSDFTLWAAPLRMGFPSATLKMAMDKSIPLVHPYFVVDLGEAHHRARYDHYPRLGLLVEKESDTDQADLDLIRMIFSRTAINLKSSLEFLVTTNLGIQEIADRIITKSDPIIPGKKHYSMIPGVEVTPPNKLTIFNGSPRGRKGNTPIMLTQIGKGFAEKSRCTYEMYNLNRLKSLDKHVEAFENAECIWFGFPLYTDAMPGMVKTFIEALDPLRNRESNPPIGFLVQSGFPEAHHSRYIERYLQKLAHRLRSPYLGTIIKGGGEGVRMIPVDRNAKLFDALQRLGWSLARTGSLYPELVRVVSGIERYPAILAPFFKIFVRLPIASWYWDMQLKKNGVYEKRFAQPYLEGIR